VLSRRKLRYPRFVWRYAFEGQIHGVFWIQRDSLQLLNDLLVPLEIVGSFKVGGPYQAFDEYDPGVEFGSSRRVMLLSSAG
jgi:hypothetical protein